MSYDKKFRGQRKDTGEWIEGGSIINQSYDYTAIGVEMESVDGVHAELKWIEVCPSTVEEISNSECRIPNEGKTDPEPPTPQELAQILANATGQRVTVFKDANSKWWYVPGVFNLLTSYAVRIYRSVKFDGNWQDSPASTCPEVQS